MKFSAKCNYSDDKQIGEHLRHMQCKVITFVMVKWKLVKTVMTDIE